MNAALAAPEKKTEKYAIMNLHVNRPPKVPSSLKIGHGPICRNFVSPRVAVIAEMPQVTNNQIILKVSFPLNGFSMSLESLLMA